MSDSATRLTDGQPSNEVPQMPTSVFKALPGAYLLLTPDLKIAAATDAYLTATQTVRENLVGQHVLEALPEQTQSMKGHVLQQLQASLEQVLATGAPHEMPQQCIHLSAPQDSRGYKEHYVVLRNTPVLTSKGRVEHIIHEVVNLTENVQAEQSLQQSQAREARANAEVTQKTEALKQMVLLDNAKFQELNKQLKHTNKDLKTAVHLAEDAQYKVMQERNLLDALLEQAPVAIGLFQGEDFVVTKANNELCAMWGYSPEQVIGKPLLEGVPELQGQGFTELMAEVVRTREPFIGKEVPAQLLQSSGLVETHYFNFVYQPLYDRAGAMLGVLDIAIDVTEQVLYRQQVESLNEQLESRVTKRTQEVQKAQAEAERQRNRLENLFMHAPAAICILSGPDLVFE
ncbi:MAG: PAS domain-containing protein, partial [Pontibacter sp.]|nr:PAS domain-containing protein [Pontibacter sp.]